MTPGQPILVGHHSEKRHRRDLERIDRNMQKGFAEREKANRHESRADNIESQLEKSIYDDDPDAVEALRARIEGLEEERARVKLINAWFRKAAKRAGIKAHDWSYARHDTDPEKKQQALDDVTGEAIRDADLALTEEERPSAKEHAGQPFEKIPSVRRSSR